MADLVWTELERDLEIERRKLREQQDNARERDKGARDGWQIDDKERRMLRGANRFKHGFPV